MDVLYIRVGAVGGAIPEAPEAEGESPRGQGVGVSVSGRELFGASGPGEEPQGLAS